jgi:hypothetical protein
LFSFRAADGPAAEEGFVGQAEEDLPDENLIREAGVERRRSCSCGLRHGRRLKIFLGGARGVAGEWCGGGRELG